MQTVALVSSAHIHSPKFIDFMLERNDINLKYVWDDNAERGQAAAKKAGAIYVADLQTILDDDELSATIICSETIKHEALLTPILEAKKHVFVEKPLGFAADDAQRMANAIQDAGVLFSTGFFMRGWGYHVFLKEQIDAGHFGKITRVRHSNCHSGSLGGWFDTEWRWMADPSQAGVGAFGDLGAHSLDILVWLLGEVEAVTADIKVVTGRYGDCDESGEALIKFKNGTLGTLAAGWVDSHHPFRLQINGTEGNAMVLGNDLYFESKHVEGSNIAEKWTHLAADLPHAFELFLDAINAKDVPLISAHETAYRNTVMEAMYEAAKTSTWIDLT